ncbi:hypothetical protein LOTGIDRAFT_116739 [Lottia gigantea]|uniref:Chitin-binding type-4 domain-containing protein n=1 Tax=Lottia gigantea TaxID=225164 RepID=V3ZW82_LOTGI|nr:hypothetical protein LOTGIDRAFT_116739 [Lottia gigantea]ESO95783.1 hypothetical protein LOTGIDRAFT_116739 [Lottia gigantea]
MYITVYCENQIYNMVLVILITVFCFDLTQSHARLRIPAQRSSLWRDQLSKLVNPNDNEINCGGFYTHHYINKGKCGVCGDAYNAKIPDHQPPGKYAQGIISGCYAPGTKWIDIKVEITANHLGYFQFKLCPNNDIGCAVEQSCLDTHILMIKDLNGVEHGEKYTIKGNMKDVYLKLRLPEGLSCSQCVLQWTYTTGNNWGCLNKWCGLGYGAQETFINCADIAVSNDCPTYHTAKPISTELTDEDDKTYSRNCVPVGIWAVTYYDVIKRWCQVNCVGTACPPDYCNCS